MKRFCFENVRLLLFLAVAHNTRPCLAETRFARSHENEVFMPKLGSDPSSDNQQEARRNETKGGRTDGAGAKGTMGTEQDAKSAAWGG